MKIGEAIYKSQQADAEAEASEGEDDIVDAEFEEVADEQPDENSDENKAS